LGYDIKYLVNPNIRVRAAHIVADIDKRFAPVFFVGQVNHKAVEICPELLGHIPLEFFRVILFDDEVLFVPAQKFNTDIRECVLASFTTPCYFERFDVYCFHVASALFFVFPCHFLYILFDIL
jgi:hypothetical protein